MPKKIKVLFYHRSMEMGGVERVILDLFQNLPQDLFDITLLLNTFQGELRHEIPPHIRVITVQKGREDMSSNKLIKFAQLVKRAIILWYYRKNPKALFRKFIKTDFDIEVASGYTDFDAVLNSPMKARKIAWFHSDVSYDPDQKRVMSRITSLKKFDWVIFGSLQTRDVIKELYHIEYPNSCVIYNAIKIDEARKKSLDFPVSFDQRPVFSSMGRLHIRKNYHTLMKVHKRLLDDGFEHSIAVIGGGSEMENLKTQAKDLDVEKSYLLLDSQINPYPYIKNSDYFIFPSESESYPLTIGEVMGLEIPVISTNVGGIPEMIEHNYDGLLVEPNEESIYQGMKLFLTDKTLVEKIKTSAKVSVTKFDNDEIYRQVTSVFEKQYQLKQ